jgi:hypothetical protein
MTAKQELSSLRCQNEDQLPDLICLSRLAKRASGNSELELAECEKRYACDAAFLAERGHFSLPLSTLDPLAHPE